MVVREFFLQELTKFDINNINKLDDYLLQKKNGIMAK